MAPQLTPQIAPRALDLRLAGSERDRCAGDADPEQRALARTATMYDPPAGADPAKASAAQAPGSSYPSKAVGEADRDRAVIPPSTDVRSGARSAMALQQLQARGLVSNRAAEKFDRSNDVGYTSHDRGFDRYVGSTSADGKCLTRDEASSSSKGEVPRNELDHRTNQQPKSAGFRNPMKDWGPKDLGQLNARANKRSFPSESTVSRKNTDEHWLTKAQPTTRRDESWHQSRGIAVRWDTGSTEASVSRAKASSANEWHPGAWYGDPASRQE